MRTCLLWRLLLITLGILYATPSKGETGLPAPQNLIAKIGSDGRVILNFAPVASAQKYLVWRSVGSPPTQFSKFAWVDSNMATSNDSLFWSRDFFQKGTTYSFKVSSWDPKGELGESSKEFASVVTSNLQGKAGTTTLSLLNEDGSSLGSTPAHSFETVLQNSTNKVKRFLLKNTGGVNATLISLSGLTGPFSARVCSSIEAGKSCILEVTFSSRNTGSFLSNLTLSYNNGASWAEPLNSLSLKLIGAVRGVPLVSQIAPPVAASGQQVFLSGRNLRDITSVEIGGTSATISTSGGQTSLTVPAGLNRGEKAIKVNGIVQLPKLKVEPFCSPENFVSPEKDALNLAINHRQVVDDSNAKFNPGDLEHSTWSFGYLMGRIAGFSPAAPDFETKTAQFVENWAKTFGTVGTINGHKFGGRTFLRSRGGPSNGGGIDWPRKFSGILDLNNAPIRLIAIMYRPDLAEDGIQAGEGRFVFEVDNSQFTLILEYGLPINQNNSAADWAKRWAELSTLQLGTPEYLQALKTVTDSFTNQRFPGRPNESAINQVRTNEIRLGSPWQLREWRLLSSNGSLSNVALVPDTVKQTPKPVLAPEERNLLELWWTTQSCSGSPNPANDCSDVIPIPSVLAGAANTDGSSFGIGDEPNTFDMITCNGCHALSKTSPNFFVHVSQGRFSNFLKTDLNQRREIFRDSLARNFCK